MFLTYKSKPTSSPPPLGYALTELLTIMVIMLSSVPPQGSPRMGFTRVSIIKQAEESESHQVL